MSVGYIPNYVIIMKIKKNSAQTIVNIIDLLNRCELNDLKVIKTALDDLIHDAKNIHKKRSHKNSTDRRSSPRYATKIMSTLVRITDVKPGQKKEFNAEILDISRHGLRLRLDAAFLFSRIVKVTFACPGQMTKQCYLEIAHMKKISNDDGVWLDIGCHGVISEKQVRLVRGREIRINKIRKKLKTKYEIKILVVGSDSSQKVKLVSRLKAEDFQVRRTASITVAIKILKDPTCDLVLFTQGAHLANNNDLLETICFHINGVAKLVLLASPQNEDTFLEEGFDHVLICNGSRDELIEAVEIALMNYVNSQNENSASLNEKVTSVS